MRFRSILPMLLFTLSSLGAQEARPVVVCSQGLEPLMLLWADQMQAVNPQAKLDLRANVATEVAKALIAGQSQLAPMDREFKPEELSAFAAKWGYQPTRMAIGIDSLVVLVQKNNPLKGLRIDQLDAIWTTSRLSGAAKDIRTWGDLGVSGGNWSNRPIVAIDRPLGDGLRDYFRQYVTRGGNGKATNQQSSDAMTLVEDLLSNQAAISYGSLGEVFNNLRTVPVVPPGGKVAVEPSYETVASGEYPLTRIVYFYFNRAPNHPIDPALLAFLRMVVSPQGQKQLAPMGLVPLPQDVLMMNKQKLES